MSAVFTRLIAVVRRIPRGRVASYGQVARLAGLPRYARHVGYALHALPDGSSVPWHRVVNVRGGISLGAWGGAAETQALRLQREGVRFDARGCVPMGTFGWEPRRRGGRPSAAAAACAPRPPRRHRPAAASTPSSRSGRIVVPMLEAVALPLVKYALSEDVGTGDITSLNCLRAGVQARASLVAKAAGVVAGADVARLVFREVDPNLKFRLTCGDGSTIEAGQAIAQIVGDAGSILKAERTALNFLQHLSGIATLTRRYVEAIAGTGATILDTRKTTPGLRFLEKFAVKCGGGENHRLALWDMYLVKDNHIRAAGGVTAAIDRISRTRQGDLLLEVEIETLDQLREALRPEVDRILVDNRPVQDVRTAIEIVDAWCREHPTDSPRAPAGAARWPEVEVSGGLTLERVRAYAETGANYLSVGALTHSAAALDISLEVEEVG